MNAVDRTNLTVNVPGGYKHRRLGAKMSTPSPAVRDGVSSTRELAR